MEAYFLLLGQANNDGELDGSSLGGALKKSMVDFLIPVLVRQIALEHLQVAPWHCRCPNQPSSLIVVTTYNNEPYIITRLMDMQYNSNFITS